MGESWGNQLIGDHMVPQMWPRARLKLRGLMRRVIEQEVRFCMG